MKNFRGDKNTIFFGDKAYHDLNEFIAENKGAKYFLLCDENTHEYCVPLFLKELSTTLDLEIIEIQSGEEHKTIATCQQLWRTLSDLGGDRQSIILNLGGGVLTDMGGFVASTFLRGIRFINIPTTLLGMVDASIGGKTGVNRAHLKNQIGVFRFAERTLIDIRYLGSLPQNQMKSGLAEMLKHGLIADQKYWDKLSDLRQSSLADLEELIARSITLKTSVVARDTREAGLRKVLNFGHTLGHAIESYCLESATKPSLLHGEAIAIGMILESYLSIADGGLSKTDVDHIKAVIRHSFPQISFSKAEIKDIRALLKYDKKNEKGKVHFVLLKAIGEAVINRSVEDEEITAAFQYYLQEDS